MDLGITVAFIFMKISWVGGRKSPREKYVWAEKHFSSVEEKCWFSVGLYVEVEKKELARIPDHYDICGYVVSFGTHESPNPNNV